MKKATRTLQAILRQDFSSFIAKTFYTLNPTTEYIQNWHIDIMAEYLTLLKTGNIQKLIINLPPRSLKSIITSVAFPAFLLGKDPSTRIIAASYAQNLSIKHSLDTKYIIDSPWYKILFPRMMLSSKHNQKSKFLTQMNGFRMSVSVGGMVTGEGADILIIDDPHNPSHIYSTNRRQQVIDWYEQTFSTRLNNKKTGKILLIMQRLHTCDLSGYLTSQDDSWEILKIPAIAPKDIFFDLGKVKYLFKKGDIFDSNRFDKEILRGAESEMGRINFQAQYIQSPIEESSSILNLKDISYYESVEENFEEIITSWDTAIQTGLSSDYSVGSIWGIRDHNYYLIYLFRGKLSYPELRGRIAFYNKKYNVTWNLIEDHASGSELIQDLRSQGMCNIMGIKQRIDKITRFASVSGMFQSGIVKFPQNQYFTNVALKELLKFPYSKHDDIVDSISQFLNFVKSRKNNHYRIRQF